MFCRAVQVQRAQVGFSLQDSIDLFLGNYAVDEAGWTTPLRDPKDWKFLTVRRVQEAQYFPFLMPSLSH